MTHKPEEARFITNRDEIDINLIIIKCGEILIDNLIWIPITIIALLGIAILIMSYFFIQKLTEGSLKNYATLILVALGVFSIGGALRSAHELEIEMLSSPIFTDIEYLLYCAYYLVLLYAVYTLYLMSKQFGFSDKTSMMADALKARGENK